MDISVVICTYNRAPLLPELFQALAAQEPPRGLEWEILLVDNNSTDATSGIVRSAVASLRVPTKYLFEGRQGKSHALNTALANVTGEIVAFTDDDVRPEPEWLAAISDGLSRWQADAIGGRIVPRWSREPPAWLAGSTVLKLNLALIEYPEARTLEYPMRTLPRIWGANMAFRRGVFERVGGFDTRRGPKGRTPSMSEDAELVDRALRAGFRVVYEPALCVHHLIGPDRMRRRYFLRWRYRTSETTAFVKACVEGHRGARAFGGVPLWAYQKTLEAALQHSVEVVCRRRGAFEALYDFVDILGTNAGFRRAWREGFPGGVE